MILSRLALAWLIICAAFALDLHPAAAQSGEASPPAPNSTPPPKPEDLRALADLLAKPEIQDWLRNPNLAAPSPAEPSAPSLHEAVSGEIDDARTQLRELAETVPEMPQELAQARRALMSDLQQRPIPAILLPVLFFAALGSLCEWLYWRTTGGIRRSINVRWAETPSARLRGVGFRLLYGAGQVAAFAAGSVGAFLLFDWAPLLQRFVIAYLLVFLGIRFAHVLGRVVL